MPTRIDFFEDTKAARMTDRGQKGQFHTRKKRQKGKSGTEQKGEDGNEKKKKKKGTARGNWENKRKCRGGGQEEPGNEKRKEVYIES